MRRCCRLCAWHDDATRKDLRQVAADIKPIYRAMTATQAELELADFERKWTRYPAISRLWREQRQRVISFFALPPELRQIVYTTNAQR